MANEKTPEKKKRGRPAKGGHVVYIRVSDKEFDYWNQAAEERRQEFKLPEKTYGLSTFIRQVVNTQLGVEED